MDPMSLETTRCRKCKVYEVSHSALVHAQKFRAYFIHDLHLMWKQWNVISIDIVKTNVFFVLRMEKIFLTASRLLWRSNDISFNTII